MSVTGWRIRHDADAPSDPWIASNLDLGVTVFGRDRAEVVREMAGYEGHRAPNARWIARTGSR